VALPIATMPRPGVAVTLFTISLVDVVKVLVSYIPVTAVALVFISAKHKIGDEAEKAGRLAFSVPEVEAAG
jgi:hypothetical protein